MENQLSKIQILLKEVNILSGHLQAADVIDGYFNDVHKILKTFTDEDRSSLKVVLPEWNQTQLYVLARTLHDGDGFNDVVDDNFFTGYIFTLASDELASNILYNMLWHFFEENNITSIELLDSIGERLVELYKTDYFNDEKMYHSWLDSIDVAKKKL